MRCYKKRYLDPEEGVPIFRSPAITHWPPEWVYYVYVCGFTFGFSSVAQIAEYRAFYSQPLKPSFRYIDRSKGEHTPWASEEARWRFHKLPLYLWQKGKREKVVTALDRAIKEFTKG